MSFFDQELFDQRDLEADRQPEGRQRIYAACCNWAGILLHFYAWNQDEAALDAYLDAHPERDIWDGVLECQVCEHHRPLGFTHDELVALGIRTQAYSPEDYEMLPETEFWPLVERLATEQGVPLGQALRAVVGHLDKGKEPPPALVRRKQPALQ